MRILSIMGKNSEIISFDYFDEPNNVYEKTCKICDHQTAITVLKQFENKKAELFRNTYFELLRKAKEDPTLGIITRIIPINENPIHITIFDSEKTIFDKYSYVMRKELNDSDKKMILDNYNLELKHIVENIIFEKGQNKNVRSL